MTPLLERIPLLALLGVVAMAGVVYTAWQVPWPPAPLNEGNVRNTPVDFQRLKQQQQQTQKQDPVGRLNVDKVPVDLHVMSICPDAVFCENTFSDVLEQVGEIMEFTTQYIAQLNGDEITCKHGANECEGNQIQLCARATYPEPAQWFNFILCQDESVHTIPHNTERCADRVGLNATTLTSCGSSERGNELHRASIELTNSRKITKSCSVVINNELVCIRDGGQWYNCPNGSTVDDFVHQICAAYTGNAPPAACRAR